MAAAIADRLKTQFRDQQRQSTDWDHWRLHESQDGVLWLYFDKKDSSANTLNGEVLSEFDSILATLEAELDGTASNPSSEGSQHASATGSTETTGGTPPRALVIRSLKPGGFCAGADINQFSSFTAVEVRELLQRGHGILDRLAALRLPTIAAVHGHCLGGGLELALACDYRIGISGMDGSLEMGFPEIQLGLHPGLGGTFRLINLIDPITAMTMMLTGKSVHHRQTLDRGLVNLLVEERQLENAVAAVVDGGVARTRQTLRKRLQNTSPIRQLAASKMRAETARKAPPQHYPAPYALIDLWRRYGGDSRAMQRAEIESFASLLDTDTSRNLVRVFFLRERMKQAVRQKSAIRHVHVIGAGAMGGDIAAWCALQGYRVSLSDISKEAIAAAVKSVTGLCRDKHKSSIETRDTLDRLVPDPDARTLGSADLVIEAVPENVELKQKIYQQVEPRLKETAILATNTSSIPLQKLASFLTNPARLVGIHFFNPVARMLVVEVVSHDKISEQVQQQAMAFTAAIGKLPVPVQSYPGFLVNRALTPYLQEAMMMLDEGLPAERIDQLARDFGMPMGPIELADQVGLDICLHVADVLNDQLDKPMAAVPAWLRDKVRKGELGKKSGQGFYQWKDGRAQKGKSPAASSGNGNSADNHRLTDRLLLPLLNACVECWRENVVADLDQLDAAMIFATGFAPFRGGPMHYAKHRGVGELVAALESLATEHGERFKPDDGWKAL